MHIFVSGPIWFSSYNTSFIMKYTVGGDLIFTGVQESRKKKRTNASYHFFNVTSYCGLRGTTYWHLPLLLTCFNRSTQVPSLTSREFDHHLGFLGLRGVALGDELESRHLSGLRQCRWIELVSFEVVCLRRTKRQVVSQLIGRNDAFAPESGAYSWYRDGGPGA